MAVTEIWKISSKLNKVINYVSNNEKTLNSDFYKELHNVLEYATTGIKTEKKLYVSGINCCPESAYEEMIITKNQWNKISGIQGFHAFQSFKEDEVTPSIAHEIGVKLAEEMWGDRFEVVVCTHLNTNHLHNHFVVNSVSFKDGKKYYDTRQTYSELRHLSDSLCEEYGLSVIKKKQKKEKYNCENYHKKYVYSSNYYSIVKEDLDRAIEQAYSYKDFETLMGKMGYDLTYRANKLSVRKNPYKKNIRISRAFGEDYSIDTIKERIKNTSAVRIPFIEEYAIKKKTYIKPDIKKPKNINTLFIHYCYLLKVFKKKYPYIPLTPAMRLESKNMDKLSNEAKLLVSKGLKTYEQFFLYKSSKYEELNSLLDKRTKLWYKYRVNKNMEEKNKIRKEISILSKQINSLQEETELLKDIEKRIPKIEKNTEEFNNQLIDRKERDINESVR